MKGNRITAEKIPTKHEAETFWKNIWQAPDKTFNENSSWLHELEMIYYSDVQTKHRKSPDRDLLIGYWFKKFTFYTKPVANLYQNTFEGSTTLPDWLTLMKTILLPKNEYNHAAKKLSTNCLLKPHL